jgi:hypothetical protein
MVATRSFSFGPTRGFGSGSAAIKLLVAVPAARAVVAAKMARSQKSRREISIGTFI